MHLKLRVAVRVRPLSWFGDIKNSILQGPDFWQVPDYVTGQFFFKSFATGSRFSLIVETKVGDSECYIKGAKTQ